MVVKLLRRSQHAHVLVCRSCGDAFSSQQNSSGQSVSALLKKTLENELLSGQGQKWQVRIVESGCLDVCPVGAVSVRLVGAEDGEKTLTWTCDPHQDVQELVAELKKYLSSGQNG